MSAFVAVLLLLSTSAAGQEHAVAIGEQLFKSEGCYGCHTVGRFGTPLGPDLSHVGARYSKAYFERWLRNPPAQRPGAHMARLELTQAQVDALAAYLASLE